MNNDILILCNTKRQLNRCKRKMMQVMDERHYSIKTIEEANQYLENEFLSFINLKFSVMPKDGENAHRNAVI